MLMNHSEMVMHLGLNRGCIKNKWDCVKNISKAIDVHLKIGHIYGEDLEMLFFHDDSVLYFYDFEIISAPDKDTMIDIFIKRRNPKIKLKNKKNNIINQIKNLCDKFLEDNT